MRCRIARRLRYTTHIMETLSEALPQAAPRTRRGCVLLDFLYWYFVVAPRGIFGITQNYLVGTIHRFSIPLHLRTLFSYWHRDFEVRDNRIDPARALRVAVVNTISRIIGFLVRATTIALGLGALALVLAVGMGLILFWLFAPFVLVFAYSHEPTRSLPSLHLPALPPLPALPKLAPPTIHGIL